MNDKERIEQELEKLKGIKFHVKEEPPIFAFVGDIMATLILIGCFSIVIGLMLLAIKWIVLTLFY